MSLPGSVSRATVSLSQLSVALLPPTNRCPGDGGADPRGVLQQVSAVLSLWTFRGTATWRGPPGEHHCTGSSFWRSPVTVRQYPRGTTVTSAAEVPLGEEVPRLPPPWPTYISGQPHPFLEVAATGTSPEQASLLTPGESVQRGSEPSYCPVAPPPSCCLSPHTFLSPSRQHTHTSQPHEGSPF